MKLKDLFRSKFFYVGLFVLIIAVLLTTVTSNYVVKNYNPPVLEDFILDNLIYIRAAWVYDILAVLAIILTGVYVITKKPQEIPYVLLLYGIIHFLRAIFILITPLGDPGLNNNPLLIGPTFVAGLFFSGHTADTFLGFLVSKGKFKIILITLLMFIILFLLLARGHYSIDIFSGILFTYAVFCFGEKYLKRQFTIEDK